MFLLINQVICILLLKVFAPMEILDWWTESLNSVVGWRHVLMDSGVQSVMMAGQIMMQW